MPLSQIYYHRSSVCDYYFWKS